MAVELTHKRPQGASKSIKILFIEDSDDHWLFLKKAIQQCIPEASLVYTSDPHQALQLLNEWSTQEWELPKLIFQDLYMPTREDGWNLLRQIKVMPASCSRIPVIMLSSSNTHTDITDAYQRGVSSYLVKPSDFAGWLAYFKELRTYSLDTVTLLPVHFSL